MPTEEERKENLAKMDAAAAVAKQEFMDEIVATKGDWKAVLNWALKHYPTAGYRRLGTTLVELAKNMNSGQASES